MSSASSENGRAHESVVISDLYEATRIAGASCALFVSCVVVLVFAFATWVLFGPFDLDALSRVERGLAMGSYVGGIIAVSIVMVGAYAEWLHQAARARRCYAAAQLAISSARGT